LDVCWDSSKTGRAVGVASGLAWLSRRVSSSSLIEATSFCETAVGPEIDGFLDQTSKDIQRLTGKSTGNHGFTGLLQSIYKE
jgi:hypothetical protein